MSKPDLAHTPATSAPPGMVSNLENPTTKNTSPGMVLSIFGMCLATLFLMVRVYTKAFLARLFGIDDVALIISWVLSMAVQISIVHYMAEGIIGTHIWDISVEDLKSLVRVTAVNSVVYLAVMALAKFSILFFYLRLSREKWFTRAIYATMGLVASFSVALMLALIFACKPFKRVWDPTITEGYCLNRGKMYLATAGLNAATDVIMLLLPMPMLRKLQVPRIQKIGLVAIFSIGSLTMATSLIRLCLMPPLIKNLDMPWALTTPSMWICIEGNLVIICGCLPMIRLFLRHVCPRLIGECGINSNTGRSGASKRPENASAELSNLERKKDPRKSHARMNDFTQGETLVGPDDGSETCIIEASGKGSVTVDSVELGHGGQRGGERNDSAAENHHVPPRPYSQIHSGPGVPSSPPPGHVELPPKPF
ncbi:hypothetical protein Slin15195_G123020 [Septoria linicola]|uniref:Rhodopsin domain-containing protein n=1 Tax=Septoria linicola TaxID=215465 RepID=A0A9Q9ERW2_9PEZI|nr:hypothetical protein Slin15195_G123020 [Septoria linicola]